MTSTVPMLDGHTYSFSTMVDRIFTNATIQSHIELIGLQCGD